MPWNTTVFDSTGKIKDIRVISSIPDFIIRAGGGENYTLIQDAIDDMGTTISPGDLVEIQANTPGGDITFAERMDFTGVNGSNGNEFRLIVRTGDNVRLIPTGGDTRTLFNNSSYIVIEGILQHGDDSWTNAVPYQTADVYPNEYGFRVENGSHHIDIVGFGDLAKGNSNKIWCSKAFYNNQFGLFGQVDGVHHCRFLRCHFELHGNNNNTQASQDFGDILRLAAPSCAVDDCTFYQAGHNTVSVEEEKILLRRIVCDGDWRPQSTGTDGYRTAEISGNKSEIGPGFIVVEHCCFRNGLENPGKNSFPAVVKYQARRGVFRYCHHLTGDGKAIRMDRDSGNPLDGSTTESKVYGMTVDGVESIIRTVCADADFNDFLFETSWLNFVATNLGAGDNIEADVYIYKDDESDRGIYADGWKGDDYRSWSIETAGITFKILLDDDTGLKTIKTLADALIDWSPNFSNFDEETCTYTNLSNAQTSFDIDVIEAGLVLTFGPKAIGGWDALTTMVGSGSSATAGTFLDPRGFAMLDTELDLSYFGYLNDQVVIDGNSPVRLLTLNRITGDATWDNPISWSGGADADHYDEVGPNPIGVHVDRGGVR